MGEIRYQIDADSARAVAQLSKAVAKQEEMIAKLRGINRASRRAGGALQGVISKAAGFVSLASAIAAAKRALELFQRQASEAAQGRESVEANLKRLVQISGGDQQRYQAYLETAAQLGKRYGIGREQALSAVFQGASLGLSNQQIIASGRYKAFAADIGPLLEAGAGIGAAFGKKALGGGQDARINALLAGAESSKVSVEQLAANVLGPAQAVKKLGGTAAETIAAVGVAGVGLKSVEEAATAVGRFSDIMARHRRFKGLGIAATLEQLAGMSERQLVAIVGANENAEKGMRVLLENREQFVATLEKINASVAATGTPESRIAQAVTLSGKVLAPLTAKQRAEAARTIAEEQELGRPKLEREAIKEAMRQELTRQGAGAFRRAASSFDLYVREFLGADASDLERRAAINLAPTRMGIATEEAIELQRQILQAIRDGNTTRAEALRQKMLSAEPVE